MAPSADHYATLKIAPDADIEVVKAAYRALMLKYHPDQNRDNPAALAQATRINAAYDILGDTSRRATYDAVLASARFDPFPPAVDRARRTPRRQPFEDGGGSGRERGSGRRGFKAPRLRDFLIATLIWRAAGMAAALVVVALGGLYLKHELASISLTSGGQFSRIAQAIDGAGGPGPAPVYPHIIHVQSADLNGSRPTGFLTWIGAQLTRPHYSREVIDGAVIYRRDDPWRWLEAGYRRITQAWGRAATKTGRSGAA